MAVLIVDKTKNTVVVNLLYVNENHIELVEPQITSEIKMDSSGIEITRNNLMADSQIYYCSKKSKSLKKKEVMTY